MADESREDDFLDDFNLDDIDFDSLLDEDKETKGPASKRAKPDAGDSGDGDGDLAGVEEFLLDDETSDWLSDDTSIAAGSSSTEPSAVDKPPPLPDAADPVPDPSNATGSDDDILSEDDLLSEEEVAPVADGSDAGEELDLDALVNGSNLEASDPEASSEAGAIAAGANPGAENPDADGGKEKGRRNKTRGKKASRKVRVKKEREPRKEKKPKREKKPKQPKVAAAVAAPAVKGSVRFICSECYEEFHLSSSYASETVTCPECLHVGKRPDNDFLRTVNIHKSGERRSFAMASFVGMLLFVALSFLVWLQSPFCTLPQAADPNTLSTWTMGLAGTGGLLAVVFLWLLTRFENNRWEVYF